MNGLPVVTSIEMQRLEKAAVLQGENEEDFMTNAGIGIGHILEQFLLIQTSKHIHLLIGKGNKGGDAFTAGTYLLQKGFSVAAHLLFPLEQCSPLCQKKGALFKKLGGEIAFEKTPHFEKGIILDGLLGTGYKGKVDSPFREIIETANQSELPIFAIDIPSGLNGTDGFVETIAIKAHTTLFLGLPKLGFFINDGWNHVGNLVHVDFGLPQKFLEEADAKAHLISKEKSANALPKIKRDRHKYEAGYVLAVAGSPTLSGAALMSCLGALKMGAGIVRLFYPQGMQEALSGAPYELIKQEWDLLNDDLILEEAKRAKAFILGPGMGRSAETKAAVIRLLSKITLPIVLDADALYFLSQEKNLSLPEKTIITPHHGEMQRILNAPPTLEDCQNYVKNKKVTLVLKGAPTFIFHPDTEPLIVPHGDPGMAKAGTGDILTGMIAALVAQGLNMREAAALGVLLHALAGEWAAAEETSYCILATELLNFLPDAIIELQTFHHKETI